MEKLTIIACIGKNRELGLENNLIWRFKEDMRFFKTSTMGKDIIMGRKTLESLPKLLEGRNHLVLTHAKIDNPLIKTFSTVEEFLEYARDKDEEIMVIGGASVYRELLPYTSKMLLTEVEAEAKADVYFPQFERNEWDSELLTENEEKGIKYKRLSYTRKKNG